MIEYWGFEVFVESAATIFSVKQRSLPRVVERMFLRNQHDKLHDIIFHEAAVTVART